MRLIHLIADYGVGDPAFSEVIQKLISLNPDIRIIPTSVPSFSTIATGYWTYQFAMVNPVRDMAIFTNTAPRKDNINKREKNEGEGLVYGVLKNGTKVIGVNSGYCFSFVKNQLQTLNLVNVSNKGSQFRSRDFYPDAVIGLATGNREYVGLTLDSGLIPDPPANRIAWTDGYGNIKTTNRLSSVSYQPGQPVLVTLNNIKRTAFFTDGTFSVREGELAYAPGSSGADDRFMEIFLRGLSAWRDFNRPKIESEFTVSAQ